MQKKIEQPKAQPKRAIRIEDENKLSITSITLPHIETIAINFNSKYQLGNMIGEGAHGLVKKAIKVETGEQVAVKISRSGDPELVKTFTEAYKNTRILDHQYIIKVYECYIDEQSETLYLVMEYSNLRSLEDVIKKHKKLTEEQAKLLIRHILLALQHIHERGVAHRDLKPDNVLINKKSLDIKIIDFGVSRRFKKYNGREFVDVNMWTRTGNVYYAAPEILTGGGYDERVDLWSLGVCLFRVLSGQFPFFEDSVLGTIEKILKGTFELNENISLLARDLIRRLLDPNPAQRLSAQLALQHPWLYHSEIDPISPNSTELVNKVPYRASDDICDISQSGDKNTYYSRNLHMRSNTMTKSPVMQSETNTNSKSPLNLLKQDLDEEIQQSPLIKLKKIQNQMNKEINIIKKNESSGQGLLRIRQRLQMEKLDIIHEIQ
ncbi:unnamed protein product (macronuclear) [Paramecium tetraurelia]|uniref:Protein kinase domain-containing protein n=1 Tax=Paramecium tetraurelia TaxID=5888 RepID=A0BQX1_PARTE|nr:uncharacterized protein GSPATT00031167001 [Paramecium tetraurelia]CAK60938.1 unnamed protein product [Paramecium tetraurelia]|eukprot:XP_001428336.1 hypothetical protein (macronuclear) [Paramecium tetraurelia strain d4-2]